MEITPDTAAREIRPVPDVDSGSSRGDRNPETVVMRVMRSFGMDSLAVSLGVSVDELAIGSAAVIGGVAGPGCLLQAPWGWQTFPPLDLVMAGEKRGTGRLLGCLVAPAEVLQRKLVQNMSQHRPCAIDFLIRGVELDGSGAKGWMSEPVKQTLKRHFTALVPSDGERSYPLRDDLRHDPVLQRREAALHPRFLLRGHPGRDFGRVVADCHRKHGLLVLERMSMICGDEPDEIHQEMERILGVRQTGGASDPSGRGIDGPATVRAILGLEEDHRIKVAASAMFRKFLWVPSANPPREVAGSFSSARFHDAFQDVIAGLLDGRRRGDDPRVRFASAKTCEKFSADLREYEAECDAVPGGFGDAALGLPVALFRSFSLLRDTKAFGEIPDQHLVTAAFSISRRARGRHVDAVSGLIQRERVDEAVRLARDVVGRIEEIIAEGEPPKFRDIRRRFKRQKKERFEPVVEALVDLGVVVLDDEERYLPGDVPIDEVEEDLREKLARRLGK